LLTNFKLRKALAIKINLVLDIKNKDTVSVNALQ